MSPTIYCAHVKLTDAIPGIGMVNWLSRVDRAEKETPLPAYVRSLGEDIPKFAAFAMYHILSTTAIAGAVYQYLSR